MNQTSLLFLFCQQSKPPRRVKPASPHCVFQHVTCTCQQVAFKQVKVVRPRVNGCEFLIYSLIIIRVESPNNKKYETCVVVLIAFSRDTCRTLTVLQKCSDIRKHTVGLLLHCNKQYMRVYNYVVQFFSCMAFL